MRCRPDERGAYGLPDLLVAAAIIALLTLVVLPGLTGYRALLDLRTTARNLVGDLRLAQRWASAKETTAQVVLSSSSYDVKVGGSTEKTVSIPSGVTVTSTFTSSTVSFNSSGSPTPGTSSPTCTASGDSTTYFGCICVTDNAGNTLSVLVASVTGRLTIYDGRATGCP